MKLQIIKTGDGSSTIFVPELNERYHSVHGAIAESQHVFIKHGLLHALDRIRKPEIKILEIGMGTGLNVFLTALYLQKQNTVSAAYYGVEANPLNENVVEQLNYADELNAGQHRKIFADIHSGNWDEPVQLQNNFMLHKIKGSIQEAVIEKGVDLVYFDAFAPNVQPEMWSDGVFSKLYDTMNPGAVIVSYCAKGEFKRTLKRCGFITEALPGPPGKREMVRGVKV